MHYRSTSPSTHPSQRSAESLRASKGDATSCACDAPARQADRLATRLDCQTPKIYDDGRRASARTAAACGLSFSKAGHRIVRPTRPGLGAASSSAIDGGQSAWHGQANQRRSILSPSELRAPSIRACAISLRAPSIRLRRQPRATAPNHEQSSSSEALSARGFSSLYGNAWLRPLSGRGKMPSRMAIGEPAL